MDSPYWYDENGYDGELNKFCKDVNAVVVSKGFWSDMHYSISALETAGADDMAVKATHDAFISQKISLIMAEGGETLEAMRKDNYGLEKKDTFEDEIADQIIRLCDLCGELNIDIEKQIQWKLKHNESRPAKHDKRF